MRGPNDRSLITSHGQLWILLVGAVVLVVATQGTRGPASQARLSETRANRPLVSLLADTRADAARAMLDQHRPGEALAMVVAALKTDPQCTVARELAQQILAQTTWNFPETILAHGGRTIDHLAFAAPSTLWLSLSGDTNTTVRWNLASLKIETVLFPLKVAETRSLIFDPGHRFVVVERGGFLLLCDAASLRPIRELGALPPALTPASVITYSKNGLLAAHPVVSNEKDSSIIWHLRDAGSGEIIRSSDPSMPGDPRPLAAFLDTRALWVFRADGSLWSMPVSPVAPVEVTPAPEPGEYLHARFSETGGSVLALQDHGPHQSPTLRSVSFGENEQTALTPAQLLETEPWTLQPSVWNGLLRRAETPLKIQDNTAWIAGRAPIHSEAAITAAAFAGDGSFIASRDGKVTIHRIIPPPATIRNPGPAATPDSAALDALQDLTEALAGGTCDASGRSFTESSATRRLEAYANCDFKALARSFPGFDFEPVITAFQSIQPTSAPADSLAALTDRIARATANPAPQTRIETTFRKNDPQAVLAAIESAGGKGAAAAKALELALATNHPEWIKACLAHAIDLPPLLRTLAESRIAWLQDRKADSLCAWPDGIPDLAKVRRSEDWDGWEQADFSKALENLHLNLAELLATLVLPENPTPEQRQTIIDRLGDPLTLKAIGRAHFANACLQAALALAPFKENAENTIKLATTARNLGSEPAPCLRAEALALTALGDYQKARDRWVSLLTEQPVESHQPGDYTEAAYTSFESADPRQAMAILTTGQHRYPNDADFALRAGWIALLTGNADQAYRYLLAGRDIGFPPAKLENATALLAIAAMQNGALDDADMFYQDLVRLAPAWENPETVEALDWPDEMKASLRQLVW